ncbi:hypothetical protein [Halochromatium roseum]|uniref:hypothetical protein n=1 Tax=Halochromatium roseum TaxID=391920 RepID=UPI0030842AB2
MNGWGVDPSLASSLNAVTVDECISYAPLEYASVMPVLATRGAGRSASRDTNMHFRVFYLINRSGERVSSTSAVEMTAKAICEQMLDRLQSEDDYLGILGSDDHALQILPEPDQNRYYVEVPLDAAKASYGRYVDREELEALIQGLTAQFDERSIPGLVYRPW